MQCSTLRGIDLQTSVLLGLLLVCAAGCQSPFLFLPGAELKGEVRQAKAFSFAEQHALLQLETCADRPYSVFLRVTVIDDKLYVDAAPTRRWANHLTANPFVRIKLGAVIYPAVAVVVDEPAVTERFLSGRQIYQLVPTESATDCSATNF